MLKRQIFQVSKTIWCLRQPSYLTCSYVINTHEGVVLVDAGMDSTGADVRELLFKMGRSEQDLRAILITHWHNDHAAGAQITAIRSGCPVYYHQAEEPWLTRKTARNDFRNKVAQAIPEWGPGILLIGLVGDAVPRAVQARQFLKHGDKIHGFEVIETPGHTPGHLSFYYPPERTLFAGDALSVIKQKVRFMARPVTLDLSKARHSMALCLEKDLALLCPGHRQPLTQNVAAACLKMRTFLQQTQAWPFWG